MYIQGLKGLGLYFEGRVSENHSTEMAVCYIDSQITCSLHYVGPFPTKYFFSNILSD